MPEKSAAVELREVTKKFGDLVAVREINLTIAQGEFFSLLGPSGCGKTTTLRMIGGFEIPTEGQVFIDGEEQGYRPAYKRPVNTVFQSYALFPHMNVYDNVAFGLQMQGVAKDGIPDAVSNALAMVQLAGYESRRPDQLSGGQQQRVAVARALINRPKVLLLDEPLGSLDLKLRKTMQLELKELQERLGITFIYVTHDQEEALTMSDRIAVMHEGEFQQSGSGVEIYENPKNRFVADFIGETNFLEATVDAIDGEDITLGLDGIGQVYAKSRQEIALGQSVTLAVRPEKLVISSQAEMVASLEGKVREVIYLGTDSRYIVRISSGPEVVVRSQNTGISDPTVFQVGDTVHMGWELENAQVLVE